MSKPKPKPKKQQPKQQQVVTKKLNSKKGKAKYTSRLLLFIISAILTYLLLTLPKNKAWVQGRMIPYGKAISAQSKHLSNLERRKMERWGFGYHMCNFIDKNTDSSSVFLIPPAAYLIKNAWNPKQAPDHLWLYPSLLYYHIEGLKMVDMTDSIDKKSTATHTLWVNEGNIMLLNITNEAMLNNVLTEFDKYPVKTFWGIQEALKWRNQNQ